MKKNIALIGMPGCGKTTIGKELASLLKKIFVDTDDMITGKSGMPIPEIFRQYGEEHFRRLETEALKTAAGMNGYVIACGGGIVLKEENRELLSSCTVIFINREISALPKNGRPVSQSRDLMDIYRERLPFYLKCADMEVKNTGIKETAQRIADILEASKNNK